LVLHYRQVENSPREKLATRVKAKKTTIRTITLKSHFDIAALIRIIKDLRLNPFITQPITLHLFLPNIDKRNTIELYSMVFSSKNLPFYK
jgi:hypothetical protein